MGFGARIINELEEGEGFSEDDDDDEDEEEKKRAGRGAEVAPPCDMTYYGATQVFIGLFPMNIILLLHIIPVWASMLMIFRVEAEAEKDSAVTRIWLMLSLLG